MLNTFINRPLHFWANLFRTISYLNKTSAFIGYKKHTTSATLDSAKMWIIYSEVLIASQSLVIFNFLKVLTKQIFTLLHIQIMLFRRNNWYRKEYSLDHENYSTTQENFQFRIIHWFFNIKFNRSTKIEFIPWCNSATFDHREIFDIWHCSMFMIVISRFVYENSKWN